MIEETASVVQCQGDFAWVETQRKSACDSCSMNKGCGTGTISKLFGDKRTQLKVINKVQAEVGDSVLIGIDEAALLTGSFLVYLLPILFLLSFALLGEIMAKQLLIENSELMSILFGLVGLALSMWWVRRKTSSLENTNRYQAVILRRLSRREVCLTEPE